VLNPFDEPRTVEWMMGPEDPEKLGSAAIDCAFALDEHGELERVRLIVDWAADRANQQLERGENESGKDFFERSRLTYRDRAGKAEDPVMARRYLEAWEMVVGVQGLRREVGR